MVRHKKVFRSRRAMEVAPIERGYGLGVYTKDPKWYTETVTKGGTKVGPFRGYRRGAEGQYEESRWRGFPQPTGIPKGKMPEMSFQTPDGYTFSFGKIGEPTGKYKTGVTLVRDMKILLAAGLFMGLFIIGMYIWNMIFDFLVSQQAVFGANAIGALNAQRMPLTIALGVVSCLVIGGILVLIFFREEEVDDSILVGDFE